MKAKEGVVNILNKVLTADLTAINQYFVHAKMCENWGYERLHHKVRERSIDEMKDADEIIGHILYLEGVPNVQRMNTVHVGETVSEQLKLDLKAEQEMLSLLNEGVVHCTKVMDFTTRHMFEDMAKDVDEHIDWIETQIETIKQIGLENYLAEQIKKESYERVAEASGGSESPRRGSGGKSGPAPMPVDACTGFHFPPVRTYW